ncbi:MAG: GNAT family N-acetyltransferase [Cyclobacteriaceae bacterium]
MMMSDDFNITHNTQNMRFEVLRDDHLAELTYRLKDNEIYLMHTGVPKPIGNFGIAKALTEFALKYALENGLKVIAYCPYVRAYMKRHPTWRETLAP